MSTQTLSSLVRQQGHPQQVGTFRAEGMPIQDTGLLQQEPPSSSILERVFSCFRGIWDGFLSCLCFLFCCRRESALTSGGDRETDLASSRSLEMSSSLVPPALGGEEAAEETNAIPRSELISTMHTESESQIRKLVGIHPNVEARVGCFLSITRGSVNTLLVAEHCQFASIHEETSRRRFISRVGHACAAALSTASLELENSLKLRTVCAFYSPSNSKFAISMWTFSQPIDAGERVKRDEDPEHGTFTTVEEAKGFVGRACWASGELSVSHRGTIEALFSR